MAACRFRLCIVLHDTRLLRVANRIHLLLQRELGEGIDVGRLLKDPLYARDVLLVCDAQAGSLQQSLARQFRQLRAERLAARDPASTFGDSSGFGSMPSSLADELPAVQRSKPSWFSPSRWLGR